MSEKQDNWLNYIATEKLREHEAAAQIISALPQDVQVAIQALIKHGYNYGFQHGRVFSGTGHEPVYHVPEKPSVALVEIPPEAS